MLEMNLAHEPIQDGLGRAIRCRRKRHHLHAANTPERRTDADELTWLRRLLQERQDGLEQEQWAVGVDGHVLGDGGEGHGRDGRVVGCDAGIGDDGVEVGDAVRGLQGGDGGAGVRGGFAVEFHDDQVAAGAGGKVGKGFGRGVVGVANGGDDGRVGAEEVGCDEAVADAYVGRVLEGEWARSRRGRLGDSRTSVAAGDEIGGVC